MSTSGAFPLNPASAVGQVRLNVGDADATLVDGAYAYAVFSDAEIKQFLANAANDVVRATGYAYLALARNLIALGKSVKTDDQSIDTRNRGKDMFEVAESWFRQADAAASAESDAFFDIATPYCLPEVGF